MYSVNLHICLVDIPKDRLNLWQEVTPRPRFKHKFYTIDKIEDIPNPIPNEHQYFIIINRCSEMSLYKLRQRIGESGTIVVYHENRCAFSPQDYELIDDIWYSNSKEVDKFHFENILNIIAQRKDAWLQSAWLQATINSVPDMIWFKDIEGLHLEVNDSFCNIVDKKKEDIRGKDHYYIWNIPKEVYEQTDYVCVQTEDDVIAARKTVLFDEDVMKADGNLSKLKTYKTPIFDGDVIIGTVGIARDVTKEYEYLQKIENLAHYDQLTGLANRNQLDMFLEKLKTMEMTIVYFDLDHFKHINDTYGHQVGDRALVAVSTIIKEVFPDALNVRIGGDEFISIFTDGTDMQKIPYRVQVLIDRFLSICKRNRFFKKLSISAGIGEGKFGHGSFDLLLQRADDALYKAKNNGRGKYYINLKEENN